MRVGSLVYATHQGLGYLAKSFYDHGVVTDVMLIQHGSHPTIQEWYPKAPITPIRGIDREGAFRFLRKMDVALFFETPFVWELIPQLRAVGVKTVLMTMYECTQPHRIQNPATCPDVLLCPSELDYEVFLKLAKEAHLSVQIAPVKVPVDVPWRQREKALTFVHNAGNGSFRDRNGTRKILEAVPRVNSPAKFLIRSQNLRDRDLLSDLAPWLNDDGKQVELRIGNEPWDTLWDEGDVFLFPESFNGLSLPLQEARAAGMFVIATDRFPMNQWLPDVVNIPPAKPGDHWIKALIDPETYQKARIGPSYMEFEEALVSPQAVAAYIDLWYGQNISAYSLQGKDWADSMSWKVLGPKYLELLGRL